MRRADPDPIRTAILAQAGRAVFDHPRDLLDAAQRLASCEPHPDRLDCNLWDYRAAQLHGGATTLAVIPPMRPLKSFTDLDPMESVTYHRTMLVPTWECPQGEVRIRRED